MNRCMHIYVSVTNQTLEHVQLIRCSPINAVFKNCLKKKKGSTPAHRLDLLAVHLAPVQQDGVDGVAGSRCLDMRRQHVQQVLEREAARRQRARSPGRAGWPGRRAARAPAPRTTAPTGGGSRLPCERTACACVSCTWSVSFFFS